MLVPVKVSETPTTVASRKIVVYVDGVRTEHEIEENGMSNKFNKYSKWSKFDSSTPGTVNSTEKAPVVVRRASRAAGFALLTYSNYSVENSLEDANLSVITLPTAPSESELERMYKLADCIVIPGGNDVHPQLYGQEKGKNTYPGTVRDVPEYYLAARALEDGKPILGICRGHQMLNVAGGGTLVQDIETEIPKSFAHVASGTHMIRLERGPVNIGQWAEHGGLYTMVNSLHHQCVGVAAYGAVIEGYAFDGVPEALSFRGHPFALGVQFHPELMHTGHVMSEEIFDSLALAALTWKYSRSGRSVRASQLVYRKQAESVTTRYSSYYGDDADDYSQYWTGYGKDDGTTSGTSTSEPTDDDGESVTITCTELEKIAAKIKIGEQASPDDETLALLLAMPSPDATADEIDYMMVMLNEYIDEALESEQWDTCQALYQHYDRLNGLREEREWKALKERVEDDNSDEDENGGVTVDPYMG